MASTKDKMGRPIVVVTGLGVVTSLGAGKTDNWAKLTAGESGIRAITRFPTDGLKTRIAGTVDFLPTESCSAALVGAPRRARRGRGDRRNPASARSGDFPGPAVPRGAADRDRMAAAARGRRASPARNDTVTYADLLRVRAAQFPDYHDRFLFGSVADHLAEKFGTQGLADLAVDRLRLRRERHPARRRGDPPRRNRCRALHRHRRLDQSGSADPLLAAVGAVDQQRPSAGGGAAVRQEPRRLRHGGRRRRAGAGELRGRARRAAPTILGVLEGCGEMADAFHRTRSSPDGKPIIGCIANALEGCRARARRYRLRQRARHRHAGKRQDGISRRLDRVRRAHEERADLVEQIDDRPHALGGRRDRGGVLAADACSTSAFRRPSITTCPIRRSRSTSCRTRRATRACATPFRIPSASAGRTSRW